VGNIQPIRLATFQRSYPPLSRLTKAWLIRVERWQSSDDWLE